MLFGIAEVKKPKVHTKGNYSPSEHSAPALPKTPGLKLSIYFLNLAIREIYVLKQLL